MKVYILLIVLFLCSCSSGEWVEYTFEIENAKSISINEKSELGKVLLGKLQKYGFATSKVVVNGHNIIVETIIDRTKKRELIHFKSIFESNKLGIWDTYRISDPEIKNVDTNTFEEVDFTAFNQLNGDLQPEILGISANENKLEQIKTSLLEKMKDVQNLDLFWSEKAEVMDLDEGKSYYKLFMINTHGKEKAPITEEGIKNLDAIEDTYGESGSYIIHLSFHKPAAEIWAEMTTRAASLGNRSVAMVINDRAYSVPRVNSPITGGRSSLSGDFSKSEAEDLVRSLRIGRLSRNLKLIGEKELNRNK